MLNIFLDRKQEEDNLAPFSVFLESVEANRKTGDP